MALTDEMQKCNFKPITIKTEAKHTIPAHSTRMIYASIPVSTEHPKTGTIQPVPQFDECSKLIIAPAITARDKKVAKKIANTTEFPYTLAADTKVAELQINLETGRNESDPSGRHSRTQPPDRTHTTTS